MVERCGVQENKANRQGAELRSALEKWANVRFVERNAAQVGLSPLRSKQSDDRLNTQTTPVGGEHGAKAVVTC